MRNKRPAQRGGLCPNCTQADFSWGRDQSLAGGICSLRSWQCWQQVQPSLDGVAWCFPSAENQESFWLLQAFIV